MGGHWGWGRGKNQAFSEYGHVAYQVKAEDAGSNNLVANILPTDTPSTQGWGQKVKQYIFLKVVAYQIKADDTGSNMVANILPTDRTPLTQGVGSKGQTISFTESSHVAYQNKGN